MCDKNRHKFNVAFNTNSGIACVLSEHDSLDMNVYECIMYKGPTHTHTLVYGAVLCTCIPISSSFQSSGSRIYSNTCQGLEPPQVRILVPDFLDFFLGSTYQ